MGITPTQQERDNGFRFWCLKCGTRFDIAARNPQPARSIPRVSNPDVLKPLRQWLNDIGCDADPALTTRLGTKFSATYRRVYRKQPRKERSTILYSGAELNTIIGTLNDQRDPVIDFFREWKL